MCLFGNIFRSSSVSLRGYTATAEVRNHFTVSCAKVGPNHTPPAVIRAACSGQVLDYRPYNAPNLLSSEHGAQASSSMMLRTNSGLLCWPEYAIDTIIIHHGPSSSETCPEGPMIWLRRPLCWSEDYTVVAIVLKC